MTDQEQITEMAVLGCVRNPQAHTAEECAKGDFKHGMCNAYRQAEALYNAGYRKADEVRRETAKKIFDALYQWLDLENTEKCGFATIQKFDLLKKFREIYQQLGTE